MCSCESGFLFCVFVCVFFVFFCFLRSKRGLRGQKTHTHTKTQASDRCLNCFNVLLLPDNQLEFFQLDHDRVDFAV